MIEEFKKKKQAFVKLKAKRDHLREELDTEKSRLGEYRGSLQTAERGLQVIRIVARETQRNLEYHLSNVVTTALASVSEDFPEFVATIEMQRNKTSLQLSFMEFGEVSKPTDSSGGGAIDVASFALRTSFWSLNKNRAVLVVDEPFKYVSPDREEKLSQMLKMLSEKLGLQIILVSHAEEVNYSADKTFHVEKIGKESKVRVEG